MERSVGKSKSGFLCSLAPLPGRISAKVVVSRLRTLFALCVTAVLTLLTWGSPPPQQLSNIEDVFMRYIRLGEQLAPVLASAKDAEGTRAAAPELEKLLPQVVDIRREIAAIESLAPGQAEKLRRKYEKHMREVWGRVYNEIFRLQNARCFEQISFFRQFSLLCSLLDA